MKFAEEVLELTGSNSKIEFHPLPIDDPKVRQPDLTKANQVLNWTSKIDRHEGLKLTIDYFKKIMEESQPS